MFETFSKNVSRAFLFVTLLALALVTGCNPKQPKTENEIINVKTYEIVRLAFDEGNLAASYVGDIDGEAITLSRVSETELAFMVPNLTPGDHTLDFELDQLTLRVTATTVANPQARIETVEADLNNDLADLMGLELTTEERERVDEVMYHMNDFLEAIAGFTSAQKAALAQIIAANSTEVNGTYGVATQALTTNCRTTLTKREDFKDTNCLFAQVGAEAVTAGTALTAARVLLSSLDPANTANYNWNSIKQLAATDSGKAALSAAFGLQMVKAFLTMAKNEADFKAILQARLIFDFKDGSTTLENYEVVYRAIRAKDAALSGGFRTFVTGMNSIIENKGAFGSFIDLSAYSYSSASEQLDKNDLSTTIVGNAVQVVKDGWTIILGTSGTSTPTTSCLSVVQSRWHVGYEVSEQHDGYWTTHTELLLFDLRQVTSFPATVSSKTDPDVRLFLDYNCATDELTVIVSDMAPKPGTLRAGSTVVTGFSTQDPQQSYSLSAIPWHNFSKVHAEYQE